MVRSPFAVVSLLLVTSLLNGCAQMNGYVMNDSGQQYFKQGNYAMAKQEFHRAVMDDPLNADYVYNLASANRKQGDVQSAERIYRHALQVDGSHQPSYHGLASLMIEEGRTDEARQLLETWQGSQPYESNSHVEMAWLQRKEGNVKGAKQSLQNALRVDPRNPTAIAHLGQLAEDKGNTAEATAYYQQSLYQQRSQPKVQARLAGLNAKQQTMQLAERYRTTPGITPLNTRAAYQPGPTNLAWGMPPHQQPFFSQQQPLRQQFQQPQFPQQQMLTSAPRFQSYAQQATNRFSSSMPQQNFPTRAGGLQPIADPISQISAPQNAQRPGAIRPINHTANPGLAGVQVVAPF